MHAQASSPKWVSFAFKTAARVHNILASILEKNPVVVYLVNRNTLTVLSPLSTIL